MDDYKNTKEGRIVAVKYADILHLSRPEPSFRHPRMALSNRAKIFSPFAALRGYEEEIAEEKWKQTRVRKKLLSEDEAAELSDRLVQVKKGMVVTIRYFKEDAEHPAFPPLGIYETITGKVEMIDAIFRQISINNGNAKAIIRFDDMEELSGEGIVSIDDSLSISESICETYCTLSTKTVRDAGSRSYFAGNQKIMGT